MGWADAYIALLESGQAVQFRPRGHSMTGRVDHGQLVTVAPVIDTNLLQPGEIVLCKVGGAQYLHLIKARRNAGQFLIGNNRGGTNGWTNADNIFGILIAVE